MDQWRAFLRARGLSYYSGRKNISLPPGESPQAEGGAAPVFSEIGWDSRAAVLFEILEFLHSAKRDGRIAEEATAATFAGTLDQVCALAKLWRIPAEDFDAAGFRENWRAENG